MASYVPWYGKKRERLTETKKKLRRLILRGAIQRELDQAAEEVRAAMVRFLRAERARVPQCGVHEARLAELDRKIAACESMPVADIVADCRVSGT